MITYFSEEERMKIASEGKIIRGNNITNKENSLKNT